YQSATCFCENPLTCSAVPRGVNWYGEFDAPKYVLRKKRIACARQSASCPSMAASARSLIPPSSDSGKLGLWTTSAYASIVFARSSFKHVAFQNQLLFPQPVSSCTPSESSSSAS